MDYQHDEHRVPGGNMPNKPGRPPGTKNASPRADKGVSRTPRIAPDARIGSHNIKLDSRTWERILRVVGEDANVAAFARAAICETLNNIEDDRARQLIV